MYRSSNWYSGVWCFMHIAFSDCRLSYNPSTMAAFYADRIIHSVGAWEADCMQRDDETTPGRIGTVFYIPEASASTLRDKEAGWALKTNFGRVNMYG